MYRKIIIATDGSDLASVALEQGFSLAKALKASVAVVSVTNLVPAMAMADESALMSLPELEEAEAAASRKALDDAAALAKRFRLKVDLLNPKAASPAAGIVEAADETGADLIVMASHGRTGFRKLMLGSQASDVLVNAGVPVLVVRSPEKKGVATPLVPMPLSGPA